MIANNIRDWLKLSFTSGVGINTFLSLLKAFESPSNVYQQSVDILSQVVNKSVAQRILNDANSEELSKKVQKHIDWQLAGNGSRFIITLADELYPVELAKIAQPPVLLFAEGNINLLKSAKIALVGSRHPTQYGIDNARNFARSLSDAGMTVVSGMAAGIDRCAHEGALLANKKATIAVIGTGMDILYPASNRDIYAQIKQDGLIISEYELGTPPIGNNFPRRNRIVVGLSQVCLVVESAIDGGSMISANFALESGRDVLAIPGSINNPMAKGCHHLIKNGAKLCESINDVVEELNLTVSAEITNQATQDTEDKVLQIMGFEPFTIDFLADKLSITFDDVCEKLLKYELSGQIVSCGGGRYQRVFN